MHPFVELQVPGVGVAIHWFGQNSFAFKDAQGTVVMVDPYFPTDRPADQFIYPVPPLQEREIKTDYILLTHDHGDHTCPESLLAIQAAFPEAAFFGPAESIARLEGLGFPAQRLAVMTAGGAQQAGSITFHAVYSKPPGGVAQDGIPAPDVEHLGYVIEIGQVRVYVSGDPIHTFAGQDGLVQPILQLKPDIGLLTTHPTEEEFPDFAGSVEMAVRLALKHAVPSHYGCFIQRTFNPAVWASHFPADGPQPIVIAYNHSIVYVP